MARGNLVMKIDTNTPVITLLLFVLALINKIYLTTCIDMRNGDVVKLHAFIVVINNIS